MKHSRHSLRRPVNCHKGDFGHLVVIAGSRGMTGAAQLTVSAAIRSGAGKTTWVTTEEAHRTVGRAIPEAMSLTFPASRQGGLPRSAAAKILKLASGASAIAAGPGLGRTPDSRFLIRFLLSRASVPMILDADALWALEGRPELLTAAKVPAIITPHEGEFIRLFGKNLYPKPFAKRIANQYHCVLVRKGPRTRVVSPQGKLYENFTGNPGLAKGGSGDVLAGMIGALVAQSFEPWKAACIGVYAHGLAADIAVRKGSQTSLTASDLIRALPAVWSKLEKRRRLKI